MPEQIKKKLHESASKKDAKSLQSFFKRGPGEYGQGDVFIGVRVAAIRKVVKEFQDLPFKNVKKLLRTDIHEYRLCALLILVKQFDKGSEEKRAKIYEFYLRHIRYINNWDLVDQSAHYIIGKYLLNKPKTILYDLASSKNLWQKRIAIVSSFRFIKHDQFKDTLRLAELLLYDKHDLIHKAVGWMLREVGKRDMRTEENFLKKHYKTMPRTMLRYAIERFPEQKRQKYLQGKM